MSLVQGLRQAIRDVKDFPKPGIIFKDITPVFSDPALMRRVITTLAEKFRPLQLDAIAAVEARGFIFGSILAHELNCRFIPVRKAGKLPYQTKKVEYALEYGTASIEMHVDAIKPGWKVLIHDDLLATGGTACAAAELVQRMEGQLAGFSFIINLSFLPGAQRLTERFGMRPNALVEY